MSPTKFSAVSGGTRFTRPTLRPLGTSALPVPGDAVENIIKDKYDKHGFTQAPSPSRGLTMPCRPILIVAFPFFICRLLVNFAGRRARRRCRNRSYSRPRLSGTMSILQPERQRAVRPARPQCRGLGVSQGQHSAAGLPGQGHRRDLLLPLVDLPQSASSRRPTASSSRNSCPRSVGPASTTRSTAPPAITCTKAAGSTIPKYLDDYSLFWFRKGGSPRSYSFWAADSLWSRFQVTGDDRLLKELLPDLIDNYEAWESDASRRQRPVLADR